MKKSITVRPGSFLLQALKTFFAISLCAFFYLPSPTKASGNPAPSINFTGAVDSKGLPADWKLKVHKGRAVAGLTPEGGEKVIHIKSVNSSFALEHALAVDSRDYPYLSWTWKAVQLPASGDVREKSRDDQALQLLVAFEGGVISYVYDANAPEGTLVDRSLGWPLSLKIKVMVVNSGGSGIGKWLTNTRNVYQDYKMLFGKEPSLVKGIRLQTNTQYTGESAEGYLKKISFNTSYSYPKVALHQ